MKAEVYVVIVAGGKGLRMGGEKPKQFQDLKGRPVLMHTLERFREALPEGKLILVLPEWWVTMWRDLCRQHAFSVDHELVKGGDTRFHSVKNGLDAIRGEEGVVAVHDGVRPFVAVDVIRECVKQALTGACVVPVIAPVESVRLKQGDTDRTQSIDRNLCLLVQTPQEETFREEDRHTCLSEEKRQRASRRSIGTGYKREHCEDPQKDGIRRIRCGGDTGGWQDPLG